MTPQEAADQIDGREYGSEITNELRQAMKNAGLVAVYGASDDLMEFDGAFRDEIGCYEGGTAYLTSAGLLQNDCDNDDCPHFAKLKKVAATVIAKWDDGGFSWRYKTDIPHETFIIMEGADEYCEGIVFALADVPTL